MEKRHDQAYVFCLTNLLECLTCRQNGGGTWFYQRCMSYAFQNFQKPTLSGNINKCDVLGKSQYGFCRPKLSYVIPLVLEGVSEYMAEVIKWSGLVDLTERFWHRVSRKSPSWDAWVNK